MTDSRDVLTLADLEAAMASLPKIDAGPVAYLVHPKDMEHMRTHEPEHSGGDPSCVRCLRIWVSAQPIYFDPFAR